MSNYGLQGLNDETCETAIRELTDQVIMLNEDRGWFDIPKKFEADIALLHEEVSEAFRAYRKSNVSSMHEELADVFIRLLDTCYRHNVDLFEEFKRKMLINWERR